MTAPTQTALGIDCYETALCLVPPETCWPPVERLRALYDKTYRKWPPHVNLVYPFVRPERLDEAVQRIQSEIRSQDEERTAIDIRLDSAGVFNQRHEKTLFLHDGRDDGSDLPLQRLRHRILAAVAGRPTVEGSQEGVDQAGRDSYTMHMTVAQTSGGGVPGREADADDATAVPTDSLGHAHRYLRHKVELLPPVAWRADRFHILVRERLDTKNRQDDGTGVSSRMRLWGVLNLTDGTLETFPTLQPFYDHLPPSSSSKAIVTTDEDVQDAMEALDLDEFEDVDDDDGAEALESFDAVTFEPEEDEWVRCSDDYDFYDELADATTNTLSVASYNVLGEFTWPPSHARLPLLIRAILADDAKADVIVLQEVTDDFLSGLLADYGVRSAYPFASHGPPDQEDMEPLPSLLNMVVLSRHPFSWSWLGFERAHKGALIARFGGNGPDNDRHSLVLATVHLTHGLTDGSVSSKRAQLSGLLRYLQRQYPATRAENVVVAGDLNIHTSAYAIEQAQRRKAISPHTAQYVTSGFDSLLSRYGFVDAWRVVSKRDGGDSHEAKYSANHDELYDGEEDATYDPFTNALAAWVIGNGPNDRPERFDRILVRKPAKAEDDSSEPPLVISRFNLFGFPDAKEGRTTHDAVASDHWGIRCVLERSTEDDDDLSDTNSAAPSEADEETVGAPSQGTAIPPGVAALVVPVVAAKAPDGPLADPAAIDAALAELGAIPSDEETARRKEALDLLRSVLIEEAQPTTTAGTAPKQLVLVPVGSYGLGVWTPASDMDCLCIGVFSPATFFALARQRLRRQAAAGIRILRRVRALTGTMLELRVGEFRVDLQYCQATVVAETWPAALVLPPAHTLFDLPRQTLAKLKAARDLYCLRKAFPETTGDAVPAEASSLCTARTFRTAHRAIKTWARARGLYEARFGYLSGMQISLLLARVMKLLAFATQAPGPDDATVQPAYTVADLLVTFFQHYATFDWTTKLAFDPFFHTQKDFYVRTAREPLAILGYHRPQLNTAANASVPSVRVLADEFRRAGHLLEHGKGLTWAAVLTGGGPEPTPAGSLLAPGPAAFVRAYRSYVRIDVQYWGLSQSRGVAFVGWLESRCVLLLVDMARQLPELTARIWPARFVEGAGTEAAGTEATKATEATNGETHQYQGCYLIGLDLPAALSREERQTALAKLQEVLAHFEKQMTTGAADQYDPQWQWLSVRVMRQAELAGGGSGQQLQLDESDWGVYGTGEEEEDDDEDEEEVDIDNNDKEPGEEETQEEAPAKAKRAKDKKDKKAKKTPMAVVHHGGHGGKFRSAQDVLKRLRWDPQLDVGEYVVGYEDRFLGARERAVAAWKSEQQDEEFIPQHRILYFKRADGVVVWDRRTRKDELFGSGV